MSATLPLQIKKERIKLMVLNSSRQSEHKRRKQWANQKRGNARARKTRFGLDLIYDWLTKLRHVIFLANAKPTNENSKQLWINSDSLLNATLNQNTLGRIDAKPQPCDRHIERPTFIFFQWTL